MWVSSGEVILPMDDQQVFLPVGLATDGERLWVSDWATGDRVAGGVRAIFVTGDVGNVLYRVTRR